ncbi:MAG: hypothetical protein CO096_24820 [Armatimonadetes bacterium CG_4_9_14_3_um_filter_66_14]|nr:MAG: hypothetical protein CO096_24820 [Armatimonadetes bacterium CG_4_9_14_3_um_filter_66_14]
MCHTSVRASKARTQSCRKRTNMTRLQRLPLRLPAACAVLALFGAQPARALMVVSEKEEIQVGKEVAANAEKQYGGVLHDPQRQARLDRLARQVVQFRQRKNIPYEFKVLNNDKEINAFACPGGPTYITKKLLDMCDTDGKLAFIMGHEVSHTELQHGRKAINKGVLANAGFSILFGKSSQAVQLGVGIAWNIVDSGYSRDQEREADASGVRFMVKAGYDPYEAVHALQMLGGGNLSGLSKYFASHPATPERIQLVKQQIATEFPSKVHPDADQTQPAPTPPTVPTATKPVEPSVPAQQPEQKPASPARPANVESKLETSPVAGQQGYILATDPGSAEVWIDGGQLGRTPDSPPGTLSQFRFFPVPIGTHSVTVRIENVGEWQVSGADQVIRKDEARRLSVTLGHWCRVTVRVDSAPRPVYSIEIDGQRVCRGAGPGTVVLPRGARTKLPVAVRLSFGQATGWLSMPNRDTASLVLSVQGSSVVVRSE